ncbi:potassium-transporting ATPase subunit KdpA [Lichenifustis flavocetrariae]|uniref:Potassium-transporting ATPase potassium-binding subunit n=1 Tax=Lichenifustis flavocetrariae TaxID=2949735 RepID=A0AA42CPW9_9HYPH|nr:potassium-transporting ATPase subunit KdpA [Lichenifustis flavocetrariae]MCW6510847.1 potassium-transporting ATPase subunit KdpA [Lichenifustis flavocetrariae]
MTVVGWLLVLVILAAVVAAAVPFGAFIARVMTGQRTFLTPVLAPVERGFYALAGVEPSKEQGWRSYTLAMLAFSGAGLFSLYALQRLQAYLPLNPQGFDGVPPDLAFNTSVSFITNTNWQNYGGETTMSHLVQMAGLTVHNFVSAATGIAMAVALVRAFTRSEAKTIGNFWVDMTRAVLYLLLPLSIVIALVMVASGIPQTLLASVEATTLEGAKQVISIGPVASQEAIKELGTNGGGFFNANSAHPFESPSAWTTMLQIWTLLLIPVASVIAFGRMAGNWKEGRSLLVTMGIVLVVGVGVVYAAETYGNPLLTALGVDGVAGNLEGKELRFGQALTALFSVATTGTSTGAVVAMHDSLTPLGGLVPMFNMLLGCITPGGDGSGLYGILVVAVITVFVAGLMVGRTPEYLGKKIESREMKLAMLAILIYPPLVLGFTAVSVLLKTGLDSLNNAGPHGLSEILYAFASTTANNGSAFGGLTGNTLWYNTTLGLAMFLGRFAYIVPVLALAGSLAAKKKAPASVGTFPTDGPLFIGLLLGVIVILYLLQYFPALALGPVVEHFAMLSGKAY